MGRHAQRRIVGGGPRPINNSLLQIIEVALSVDGLEATLTFSGPVTDTDYIASDFATSPTITEPDTITQSGANGLLLVFLIDLHTQEFLRYVGNVPGVVTPQVLAL